MQINPKDQKTRSVCFSIHFLYNFLDVWRKSSSTKHLENAETTRQLIVFIRRHKAREASKTGKQPLCWLFWIPAELPSTLSLANLSSVTASLIGLFLAWMTYCYFHASLVLAGGENSLSVVITVICHPNRFPVFIAWTGFVFLFEILILSQFFTPLWELFTVFL